MITTINPITERSLQHAINELKPHWDNLPFKPLKVQLSGILEFAYINVSTHIWPSHLQIPFNFNQDIPVWAILLTDTRALKAALQHKFCIQTLLLTKCEHWYLWETEYMTGKTQPKMDSTKSLIISSGEDMICRIKKHSMKKLWMKIENNLNRHSKLLKETASTLDNWSRTLIC